MQYVIKVIWNNGEKNTFTYQNLDTANAMKSNLMITGGYSSLKASW